MLMYGTVTRKALDLRNPNPADIDIEDIAYPLANTCRYNGQVYTFYSVLQHSIRVARMVPDEFRLEGLLHDAVEAYTGDFVRPLQQQFPDLSREFKKMARPIEICIRLKYGLPREMSPTVRNVDNQILQLERFEIGHTEQRPALSVPFVNACDALPIFFDMFHDLYKG